MNPLRLVVGLWQRLSLTTRLLLGSGLALAAFGMTLLYTTVSRDVSTYRSVLAERLDNELAFITLTVTEQAVVGDYASLRRMLVLRTERADDIPMITWRDARGNPISIESAAPVLRAPSWFAGLIHMPDLEGRAPIDVGGVSYGEVTLQISPTPTVNRIWDDVKDGLQMLLLAASAIFGFIILVVTSALRPLNELSLFAKRFGEGHFAVRIPPSAMPELSPTISALNRMADDLHQLVGSLKQARATLSEEKERAQVTLASIADAVVTIDIEGRIEYVNPVAERLSGWTLDECRGQPVAQAFDLRNDDGSATADLLEHVLLGGQPLSGSGQAVLASRGGAGTLVEFSAAPIRDANAATVGAVIVVHDVSQTQKMATELSWQATHDSLTGLVNRREFERRLAALVHRMQFEHGAHCFLYIDLDQFKIVNDTCGHIAGDELLRQICVLLQKQVRDADTLARLGGDEFGVLLGNCPLDQAMHAAEKMLDAVSNFRFVWQNNSYVIGLSIGLVPIIDAEQSMTSVMTAADAACYSAKERGRNRVHVYRPDDTELAQRQGEMQWVARITRAIETDRLCLFQQKIMPIGNTEDGDHYEVLVRMRDETGALVPPMTFIPAAERYNMMPAVDRQIIRKAFDSFDRIYAPGSGRRLAQASINLSGNSLSDETFIHFIRDQFATHAVSPTQICFEITETAAIANLSDAVGFIRELKQLGCRFSLDDFGSGLSSFAYLKSLPVDALKIDGSFVKDMPQDPIDTAMVRAINNIGHVMGLKTIAEFVENDIILGMLKEIGVDYAQGYGIARPVPLDDLAAMAEMVE